MPSTASTGLTVVDAAVALALAVLFALFASYAIYRGRRP